MRRSAQDDAFLEGIEKHWSDPQKHGKIEKVTSSERSAAQDDDFCRIGDEKTTPSRISFALPKQFSAWDAVLSVLDHPALCQGPTLVGP